MCKRHTEPNGGEGGKKAEGWGKGGRESLPAIRIVAANDQGHFLLAQLLERDLEGIGFALQVHKHGGIIAVDRSPHRGPISLVTHTHTHTHIIMIMLFAHAGVG